MEHFSTASSSSIASFHHISYAISLQFPQYNVIVLTWKLLKYNSCQRFDEKLPIFEKNSQVFTDFFTHHTPQNPASTSSVMSSVAIFEILTPVYFRISNREKWRWWGNSWDISIEFLREDYSALFQSNFICAFSSILSDFPWVEFVKNGATNS